MSVDALPGRSRGYRDVSSFIYVVCRHTTQAAYPPAMDEQSLNAGILGLATHEMCGASCRHEARWALTPPFHPYSASLRHRAVIFCHTRSGVAAGFPLGNMVLSVARTFLMPATRRPATERPAASAKLMLFCQKSKRHQNTIALSH